MPDIFIKNAAGTQIVAKNVDTVILPTTDGGTATFRQWNGVIESSMPTVSYQKKNVMRVPAYGFTEPTITITKGE